LTAKSEKMGMKTLLIFAMVRVTRTINGSRDTNHGRRSAYK